MPALRYALQAIGPAGRFALALAICLLITLGMMLLAFAAVALIMNYGAELAPFAGYIAAAGFLLMCRIIAR